MTRFLAGVLATISVALIALAWFVTSRNADSF